MFEPDLSRASLRTARRGHKSASFWGAKNSSPVAAPLGVKAQGCTFFGSFLWASKEMNMINFFYTVTFLHSTFLGARKVAKETALRKQLIVEILVFWLKF
jgi:hypothetical protein